MSDNIGRLEATLALSISAIATEHFFSAGMSSPWSVAKFAKTDDDQRQVWKLFWQGAIASGVFALAIGAALGDAEFIAWALAGAVAVSAFMYWEYQEALSGNL